MTECHLTRHGKRTRAIVLRPSWPRPGVLTRQLLCQFFLSTWRQNNVHMSLQFIPAVRAAATSAIFRIVGGSHMVVRLRPPGEGANHDRKVALMRAATTAAVTKFNSGGGR